MSDDPKYTYRILFTSGESEVKSEEPVLHEWGYQRYVPLDLDDATYHNLRGIAHAPGDRDPVGLVELADGEVVTLEDARGMWDPAPESAGVTVKLTDVRPGPRSVEAIDASESDFFKRQLEAIDQSVYAAKYPAYAMRQSATGATTYAPERTWRQRLSAWVGAVRYRLGTWVAGMPLGDDEEL